MTKKTFILAALLLSTFGAMAQLQALFSYSTFYAQPQDQPYVETYLQFDAWTLRFLEQADGTYRAVVEVTIVARQGDEVKYVKKYDLQSPTTASLEELDFSFLDVQRFGLPNGIYDLELTLQDKGEECDPVVVEDKLVVYFDAARPMLSSVQLMSEAHPTVAENILSRNGYDMEPYVSDYLPAGVEQLNFYYEVYNIDQEIGRQPFLAAAYIEGLETGRRYEGMQTGAKKYSGASVPVYGSMDISQLGSGNYNLVIEVRNREDQTMLRKKVPFFRSNPGVETNEVSDFSATFAGRYTDVKELNMYIDALRPLASEMEWSVAKDLIKTADDLEAKQAFLYQFWYNRDPMDAEGMWKRYKERVDYVQAHFSYPETPGIHTDRGRVYLTYGPPDFVRDEKNFVGTIESSKRVKGEDVMAGQSSSMDDDTENLGHVYYLPYQLWRYNQLPTQEPDRVFIFWDEHRSGFYKLLHSNARGEVMEVGWERRLSRGQLREGAVGMVGEQFSRGY